MTDTANIYAADPQMKAVALGLDAQHFIEHTSLGRHLIDRAHACRVEALEGLATVNPADLMAIRTLQNKALIPDLFLQWLDEAIADGIATEETIRLSEQFE
jgi:hypothetical protein